MQTENFMDKYSTPEEFIRAEVLANRGTKNIVDKDKLIWYLQDISDKDQNYRSLSKAELFDRLVELLGEKAYTLFPVGVSSYCFQLKFGVQHKDVLKMSKAGFITATGETEFRMYGKICHAKTYSPFEYFRLTPEEVHAWLDTHSRKRKSLGADQSPAPN